MSPDFYWLPAVVAMAIGQGLLLPAIKRTAPGPEAKRQAVALHYVLTFAYYLPLALAPRTWAAAVFARLLLFDPVLNLAAGQPVFAVGSTAASDRAMQWLAGRLRCPADRVRAGLWVLCLLGAVWLSIQRL